MTTTDDWMFSLEAAASTVAALPKDRRVHYPLRHGTMRVGLYAPPGHDAQTPHTQDELYIIVSGSGTFIKNGERRKFKAQDVLFVEAGAEHRFEDFTPEFATWVIFWGADGGER
jgi:mannose-6-phosphate isomerase-like protein (cupin superfamily)